MEGLAREKTSYLTQRDLRSLDGLQKSASTSRVLNLNRVSLESRRDKEYFGKPFFKNSFLNRGIIVKHTLRPNERHHFVGNRRTVTKLVFPFDMTDLRAGGQSIFVGESSFDKFLRDFFGVPDPHSLRDVQVLRALDTLPSLDPFLVREYLGRQGFKPGQCYLNITPADVAKMLLFTNTEIEKLVRQAMGAALGGNTISLAGKILAADMNDDLDPLRCTLRMEKAQFSDGLFSWRGFLYFKWRWTELQAALKGVLEGLATYQPRGSQEQDSQLFLNVVRPRIGYKILEGVKQAGSHLRNYDMAYCALVEQGEPVRFRSFLLNGPTMFYELGEIIGILDHIVSFWRYRMGQYTASEPMHFVDYADLLMDFEDSLGRIDGAAR